jgi:glycosyltransferase involved in cell wall biosynthesis
MTSIVIPAHDEERGIARLLEALGCPGAERFEIIVVANGCSDGTADIARSYGATVIETPVASKINAMALGDARATSFPRLYVDGDVIIGPGDVDALCAALSDGVHSAAPERILPMAGVSLPVRLYYSVWLGLEGVRSELYGRGVVAVDAVGHARLRLWPAVMSDDKIIAMSFEPAERRVVRTAKVTIMPPKTYRDLLRRRVRVVAGNDQVRRRHPLIDRPSGASPGHLARVAIRRPRSLPAVAVFAWTAALARIISGLATRRGDLAWLRDESSRG